MENAESMIAKSPLENWISQKIGGNSDHLERADLEEYQCKKMQTTLQLVKEKSPFYQKKMEGFPSSINEIKDLNAFPFTTADELRNNSLQMVTVSQGDIQRVVTLDTSGTSGIPKRCFFTKNDQDLTIDFFGIGMTCLVSEKDNVLILLPGERPGSVGDLLYEGLKQKKIEAIKYGAVKNVSEVMRMIHAQKITSLVGAPSQVLALARWSPFLGDPIPRTIRSVLLSTDHVPNAIIQTLEKEWACKVFNHYGMTEMGLGGGVDCQAHHGMHMREADLFFEIINPITGTNLPEGEFGEVVFTTLTIEGMPLIRYRTGDISRFLKDPCPCSTNLKTMDWIRYRYDNTLKLETGELSLADLDDVLFGLPQVLDFRVEVIICPSINLSICVFVNQNEERIIDIQSALLSLVPLKESINSGETKLIISVKYGLPDTFGSLAKRKIHISKENCGDPS